MALKEDIRKIGIIAIGASFANTLIASSAVENYKTVIHISKNRPAKFGSQSVTIINKTDIEVKVKLADALKHSKNSTFIIEDFDQLCRRTKITGKRPKYSTQSIKNRLRKYKA